MIRGVLFDMDGVLLDTERLGRDLFTASAAARGYALPGDLYLRILGVTTDYSRQVTLDLMGADFPFDEVMADYRRGLTAIALRGELPVKKGVAECMAGLKARGIGRALATSTERGMVEQYIAHTPPMRDAFDVIVCGPEVRHSKPAPDIYLEAARRLGVPPGACAGVEDSRHGLKSLKAAGCVSVMVPDLLPYDESLHGLADYVLPDLSRLCSLVDRLALGARVRG